MNKKYMSDKPGPALEAFLDALQVFVLEVETQRHVAHEAYIPSTSTERVLAAARRVTDALRSARHGPSSP
jgi:hypothetical protein